MYYQRHTNSVLPETHQQCTTRDTPTVYYQRHTNSVLPETHQQCTTRDTPTVYYQRHTNSVLPETHQQCTTRDTPTVYYQRHTNSVLPETHQQRTTRDTPTVYYLGLFHRPHSLSQSMINVHPSTRPGTHFTDGWAGGLEVLIDGNLKQETGNAGISRLHSFF